MKLTILTFALLIAVVSCSSQEKPAELARAYEPIIDRNDQVERIITMIKNNKEY